MMNTSPSMAAIAQRAGVAKSTVSLALKNDPRVLPEKRAMIQELAASMGYQANPLVSRLMFELRKTRKQKYQATLAAVNASDIPSEQYHKISNMAAWQQGLLKRADELGYSVDHFWLNKSGNSPERLAKIIRARNIKGVVFYGVQNEQYLENCQIIWGHFPVVTIGVQLRQPALNFIVNDHYFSGVHACERLKSAGYRRIGIVLDRWLDNLLEHRYVAGYQTALLDHTNRIPVLYLGEHTSKRKVSAAQLPETKRAFAQWIADYRPDAILCINSYLVDWVAELGIRVPEEMGIALLDLPRELNGIVAGMEPRSEWTGMKTIDVLVGQINRGENEVPFFQSGTVIESQWAPGPTVRNV